MPKKLVRRCKNCRQPGHIKATCPEPLLRRCTNCGSPDHDKQTCRAGKWKNRVDAAKIQGMNGKDAAKTLAMQRCTNCRQPGHNKLTCQEPPPHRCSNCGLPGHNKRTCKAGTSENRVDAAKIKGVDGMDAAKTNDTERQQEVNNKE